MTQQKIQASPPELQTLARRIIQAEQAEAASKHATAVAADVFTMFCEGHGVPEGATFVKIEDGCVLLTLRDVPKPELVQAS